MVIDINRLGLGSVGRQGDSGSPLIRTGALGVSNQSEGLLPGGPNPTGGLLSSSRVGQDLLELFHDPEEGRQVALPLPYVQDAQAELEHVPTPPGQSEHSRPKRGRDRAAMSPNDAPASMSRSFAWSARRASTLCSRSSRMTRFTRVRSCATVSPSFA